MSDNSEINGLLETCLYMLQSQGFGIYIAVIINIVLLIIIVSALIFFV